MFMFLYLLLLPLSEAFLQIFTHRLEAELHDNVSSTAYQQSQIIDIHLVGTLIVFI